MRNLNPFTCARFDSPVRTDTAEHSLILASTGLAPNSRDRDPR